ncbi:ArsS family sensor histidine kinase [Campylobacter concisus]|uniref:ArsS family sensor histidine kinase n=1 Tax=Campylobacter concisus TaxID=199 RepID=UPI000CD92CC7|nr:ArsS family sensor histidine kinase [Campylobacter concisus]
MPKLSIVNLISFLFCVTIIVINVIFFIEYKRSLQELEYSVFQRFLLGMHIRVEGGEKVLQSLKEIDLKYAEISNKEIIKGGKIILQDSYCDMYKFRDKFYFVPRQISNPSKSILNFLFKAGVETEDYGRFMQADKIPALEDTKVLSMASFWLLVSSINGITIIFFIVLMRKLLGLRNLKKQIQAIGVDTAKKVDISSHDELGEIAHEFNKTMKKLNDLKEAKELFLRNVLHELRTPVMKGKIISDIINDEEFKDDLKQIFLREELILSELTRIEKFSSNELSLNKNKYRLIDIIDHAIDLIFAVDKERVRVRNLKISPILNVDFELFSTALKNLLDNALKYSKKEVFLEISNDHFMVVSYGDKIDDERLDFNKAFNRKSEFSGAGLGLGLYIANQIFTRHGCEMKYKYKDGKNCFLVYFNEALAKNLV